MARKRVIYQSEALYVAGTGSWTSAAQLHRVQSANYSFDIARTDVNQFGNLARIDNLIMESPTVSLDFTFYPTSGLEESNLGFNVEASTGASDAVYPSALGSILSGTTDIKNYFIVTSSEGSDINGSTSLTDWRSVIGLGNMSITSYSVDGSVGDFVSASVSAEGLNLIVDTSGYLGGTLPGNTAAAGAVESGVSNPAVDPVNGNAIVGNQIIPAAATNAVAGNQISALQPKDVQLSLTFLGNAGVGIDSTDLKVQSFSVGVDLGRTPLEKLGSRFAFSREIDFPVTATMDISANMGEMKMAWTGQPTPEPVAGATWGDIGGTAPHGGVEHIVENDSTEYNMAVCVKPDFAVNDAKYGLKWQLNGCKLDSQSFSSSIGDNKSVDFSFSTQIGGPNDAAHGLRMTRMTTAASCTSSAGAGFA
jgi:hypothetical protein